MPIEAAKGGHANALQLLLHYPHSMMSNQQGGGGGNSGSTGTGAPVMTGQLGTHDATAPLTSSLPQPINFIQPPSGLSSSGEYYLSLKMYIFVILPFYIYNFLLKNPFLFRALISIITY
jgi:hypothetical protein